MVPMRQRPAPGIEVLAHESRREIVARLAMHPYRPSVLARELNLAKSTISHHLRILEAPGLVTRYSVTVEDRVRLYGLDARATGRIIAWLAGTGTGLASGPSAGGDGQRNPGERTLR
jgi:DNA-binding transcriptional ArsR family regulator